MGNKNRKNSNYVTDKTLWAKEEKERALKRKKQKKIIAAVVAGVLSAALLAGAIFALGKFAFGWFDGEYKPTVTHHADITLEGYGTLRVELYGEDAPNTVNNFVKLANEGFYNGKKFNQLMQNPENNENILLQMGEDEEGLDPIKREPGENRISHTKGILSAPNLIFGTNPTRFFIMTSSDYTDMFDEAHHAFGKVISGLDILDAVCENAGNLTDFDDKHIGEIAPKKQAKITSITIHEAH